MTMSIGKFMQLLADVRFRSFMDALLHLNRAHANAQHDHQSWDWIVEHFKRGLEIEEYGIPTVERLAQLGLALSQAIAEAHPELKPQLTALWDKTIFPEE